MKQLDRYREGEWHAGVAWQREPIRHAAGRALRSVKAVHTLAWILFAGAIVALPLCAWGGRFDVAAVLAVIVMGEVLVLGINSWHCPLTAGATRYTADRRPNFDIYLPEWLARHNKGIFGTLYVTGLAYAWARWRGWVG